MSSRGQHPRHLLLLGLVAIVGCSHMTPLRLPPDAKEEALACWDRCEHEAFAARCRSKCPGAVRRGGPCVAVERCIMIREWDEGQTILAVALVIGIPLVLLGTYAVVFDALASAP
jgi:hypothetical protein